MRKLSDIRKNDSLEKILISSRDFLKLIIIDLCFYFDVSYSSENIKLIIEELIKVIKNNEQIQSFIIYVDLIDFLNNLGNIVEHMDNISNGYFPQLSFKYKNTNYNISEEKIKNSIVICMKNFGKYTHQNSYLQYSLMNIINILNTLNIIESKK